VQTKVVEIKKHFSRKG